MPDDPMGFSLTLFGAMNPAIHHPAWYGRVGLLNPDAEGYAQLDPGLICSGDFSSFRTATLTVGCHRDRWIIETGQPDRHIELLEITSRLFDDKLPQTPIQSYELALNYHISCGQRSIAKELVSIMPLASWGILPDEIDAGAFLIQSTRDNTHVSLRIEPSQRGTSMLYLGFSFRHGIPVPVVQEGGRFSLQPLISQAYQNAVTYTSGLIGKIVASISLPKE